MRSIPYRDPVDHGSLVEDEAGFTNPRTGFLYPFRSGFPAFLPPGAVEGPNAQYQKMYDRMAPFYNVATRFYAWLKSGEDAIRRRAYLELLELGDGGSLLEVSVGTGANWPYLNPKMDFYGLDLSAGMLSACLRRARRLKLSFQLCQGLAEHLPYPTGAFDCVFHAGGINFFSDVGGALGEMVRVAKPGTRIVVVDETEELAKRYEDKLIGGSFFKNRPRKIVAPVDRLPAGMQEVKVEEIWNHELYVLTFRKPSS